MDENEIKGAAQEFVGEVEDVVGKITGDAKTQAEGKWDKAAGRAQKTFGAAAEELRENVAAQPLTALALVGAVAFVLGYMSRR